VHGRTRSQFYAGQADWRAVSEVKARVSIPVVVNGDVSSGADASAALAASHADGVMIGRGAYGRPWLAGQIARFLAGVAEETPLLEIQLRLVDELYEEMLLHYGRDVGVRHARKHLGWALNVAAETVGAHPSHFKAHRHRILTAEEPVAVRRYLAQAYAMLADTAGGGFFAHVPPEAGPEPRLAA
jgi:tRNA-dihydrouridine synthase